VAPEVDELGNWPNALASCRRGQWLATS